MVAADEEDEDNITSPLLAKMNLKIIPDDQKPSNKCGKTATSVKSDNYV